jgi:hypothetical protein
MLDLSKPHLSKRVDLVEIERVRRRDIGSNLTSKEVT